MSAGAQEIVERFDEIVRPEGGRVEFGSLENGVLRVRYVPGVNEECATCVMTSDTLAVMMQDLAGGLDPTIARVEVDEVSGS